MFFERLAKWVEIGSVEEIEVQSVVVMVARDGAFRAS